MRFVKQEVGPASTAAAKQFNLEALFKVCQRKKIIKYDVGVMEALSGKPGSWQAVGNYIHELLLSPG